MAQKKEKAKHIRDFENMTDEETLDQVIQDMRDSQAFQQQYFDKFITYYQLYRQFIPEEKMRPNGSNLFIPYTYNVIETVVPKIINTLFATRPYVKTIPLGLDSTQRDDRAKKMDKFLDYQFQQKIKLPKVVTDVVKTSIIYGTGITKHTWKYKTKEMIQRRPRRIMGIELKSLLDETLVDVVVNDEPSVQNIPIQDFFFDPASTNIEDGRYCIHRYWEDLHELKNKEEKTKDSDFKYKNIDKIEDYSTPDPQFQNYDMLSNIGLSQPRNSKKGVEIWEYWQDDWVVRVANSSVVIYSGANPYHHKSKPFARWVDTPVPNEFYGIGEPESIINLQLELNATRNQRIDNVTMILNRMWKVLDVADIKPEDLVSRPNGVITVSSMEDIKEIDMKDVTASAYNEEATIKDDIDKTTGVFDATRGSETQRRETATTMSILQNAGNDRFKLKNLLIETDGFHDMISQIIRLNQQYIDTTQAVQILGEDGMMEEVVIEPYEILGEFDIVAVGSSSDPTANKEVRQNQLIQLYNIMNQNPYVNQQEILKRIFEAFEMKNIEALFAQQQPQGMELQQPQGMELQQGQGGGGMEQLMAQMGGQGLG